MRKATGYRQIACPQPECGPPPEYPVTGWSGVLQIFLAGAMRRIRVAGSTEMVTSGPVSGVSVMAVPLMALTTPMRLVTAPGQKLAPDRTEPHDRWGPRGQLAALAAQKAVARNQPTVDFIPSINLHRHNLQDRGIYKVLLQPERFLSYRHITR